MHSIDVAIVGGGLAGLHAAYRLSEQGRPVALYEANSRFGGRVQGFADEILDHHYHDLGPTWVFPHHLSIQTLIRSLGLSLFDQYHQGDALFQGPHGGQPKRMHGAGGMDIFRVKNGITSLVNALAEATPTETLNLSHKVVKIVKEHGLWHLYIDSPTGKQHVIANHLMLAMPPRIIDATFANEPWLSPVFGRALASTPTWMAAQAKFVATYNTPFWRESGLSGQAFSQKGPMIEMHDASGPRHGPHALFGFIGLPAKIRQQIGDDQLIKACLSQLQELYGDIAANPTWHHLTDWAKAPEICTEQDINERPQHPFIDLSPFRERLRKDNLYLISSEFSQREAGYLEGAILASQLGVDTLNGL